MREQCSSTSRGRRCLQTARIDAATCHWHRHREHLHAVPATIDSLAVEVDHSEVSGLQPPPGVLARMVVDAAFRSVVGLPPTSYVLFESAKGRVDVVSAR